MLLKTILHKALAHPKDFPHRFRGIPEFMSRTSSVRRKITGIPALILTVLTILSASCSDLTFYTESGSQPDKSAIDAAPVIYLRAEQSADNRLGIILDYGEGSATKTISAVTDKPVKLSTTVLLAPAPEDFVSAYSDSTGIEYTLLPTAFYSLSSGTSLILPAGSATTSGNELTIYSKNRFGTVIEPGRYLLPLVGTSSSYEVRDNSILIDVTIREKYESPKEAELYTGDKMFTVYYLNTAEFDPRLACEMAIEESKCAVFPEPYVGLGNIIVLRSTMLSYDEDTGKVGLEPSSDILYLLNHYSEYILPVQETGRKVLLCIDGGGKGVGFCNFTDAQIENFVTTVRRLVDTYGLDGVNLWDRNSAYNLIEEQGLPEFNTTSYPKTIKALREALGPDRLVTVVDEDEPTEYFHDVAAMGGIEVGQYIDYAWHGYFDNTEPVQIVDPWHQDASMVSKEYPRHPIAGLSPERYGCVHVTSYPGSLQFNPEIDKITEWVDAGLNQNNISIYYDIHSRRQDQYEGGAYSYSDYVLDAWFSSTLVPLGTYISLYEVLWEDNNDFSGYNAWVKDW